MNELGGASFGPEIIALMTNVLDEALATLPQAARTSIVQDKLAQSILMSAAGGERDPVRLRTAALLELKLRRKM